MAARESLKLLRTLKALEAEYGMINKAREEMLEKFAARNADGNYAVNDDGTIAIAEEHAEAYTSEVNALLATELTINCDPIPLEVLENAEFSPYDLIMLEPLLAYD